jgi:hypothetical protein
LFYRNTIVEVDLETYQDARHTSKSRVVFTCRRPITFSPIYKCFAALLRQAEHCG